jgi:hypothetical protein
MTLVNKPESTEEEKYAGYEAAQRLYKKRKNQAEKTEKSREDYEFEKFGQECTFAPQITKHKTGGPKTVKPSER